MIPITDKHLQEACRLALERDILELEGEPCGHDFSQKFLDSLQHMQEGTNKVSALRFRDRRILLSLGKILPAAAAIALVCMAGYRLLELTPFPMGSSKTLYEEAREISLPETNPDTGAGTECTPEDTAEVYTAGETDEPATEETLPETDEFPAQVPDGTEAEIAPNTEAAEKAFEENLEEGFDNGALSEADNNRTTDTTKDSTAKQGNFSKEDNAKEKENGAKTEELILLSVAYDSSTQILELELKNDSIRTIFLEKSWILLGTDGDTINMETDEPELSNPSWLPVRKTVSLRCILPDGELPEGEYTLELNGGEHTLTFTLP